MYAFDSRSMVIQRGVEFSHFPGSQGWNIRATASSQTSSNRVSLVSHFSLIPWFISNSFPGIFHWRFPQNLQGSCPLPAVSIPYSIVAGNEDNLHSHLFQRQMWASSFSASCYSSSLPSMPAFPPVTRFTSSSSSSSGSHFHCLHKG